MRASLVREMVDLVIDRAQMEHPHVGYSIWLSATNACLFPAGTHRGHEVVETDLVPDELVRLEPRLDGGDRAAQARSYVADVTEEIISVYGPVLDVAATAAAAATAARLAAPA